MQLRVYKKISAAARSIADCTSPTVTVGQVKISLQGLNSQYISHKDIYCEELPTSGLPRGVILAQSGRYTLLIVDQEVDEAPDTILRPWSINRIVQTWAGGLVPADVVRPVLSLVSHLELTLPYGLISAPVVRAYVLEPTLAGWYYMEPVFFLSKPYHNEPFELPGRPPYLPGWPDDKEGYVPPYKQGSLLIGWADIDKPSEIPVWQEGMWFLNHIIRPHGEHHDKTIMRHEIQQCRLAVMFHGEPHLVVRIDGNYECKRELEILSRDHASIVVPPTPNGWIAIHPFAAD